jgi:hypothetical protein
VAGALLGLITLGVATTVTLHAHRRAERRSEVPPAGAAALPS